MDNHTPLHQTGNKYCFFYDEEGKYVGDYVQLVSRKDYFEDHRAARRECRRRKLHAYTIIAAPNRSDIPVDWVHHPRELTCVSWTFS